MTLRDLGPFDFLALMGGAVGALLALVTLVLLTARKPGAVKVVGVLCLLAAGGVLALGVIGHTLGMMAVTRTLGNVPFDVKDELLLKGTQEARVSLLIAMIGAVFPLLVGAAAMVFTRLRVGLAVAGFVALGFGATLVVHQRPLPPGKPMLAQVQGLQLASSTTQRRLGVQPLLTLTPEGLWVDGAKVTGVAVALDDPRVREQNPLSLAVDGRTSFAALADVLEAAGRSKHHEVELVVQSSAGELAVITVRDAASLPVDPTGPPSLKLTLSVTGKNVRVSAIGGALDPMPLDWPQVQVKMMEIKANFPNEASLRITADPDVSMDMLVKALDSTRETEDRRLLFPDVALGRFSAPVAAEPPREILRAATTLQTPEVQSAEIDPLMLARYARGRKGAIQRCYEQELAHDPTLKGKIVVLFTITPAGRTADLDIEENTLGNEAVGSCLKVVIRGWVFPFKPTTAVQIAYPFVFSPAN